MEYFIQHFIAYIPQLILLIISAIIGAFIKWYLETYGFKIWSISKVSYFSGIGSDLLDFDFNGLGEKQEIIWLYKIIDSKLILKGYKANFKATIEITENNNVIAKAILYGKGELKNNYLYLNYQAIANKSKISWNGLMLIHYPEVGDLFGYFLTENRRSLHGFVLGQIRAKRD